MKEKSPISPPKNAERFLIWLLKEELAEEVLGDLEEKFYTTLDKKSPFQAKVNYWYQTFNYLRPFAIKNNLITDLNPFFMWLHHLKFAYRSNWRDKRTFLINLIGLSTGLACTLLISLWVWDELQVDKFHEKKDRLYQVMSLHYQDNGVKTLEETQGLLAEAMQSTFPEVERAVQASPILPTEFVTTVNNQHIKTSGQFADTSYFQLFDYELIEGDKSHLLKGRKSVVISDKLAMQLFNSVEVVGKSLEWQILNWKGIATITGVFKAPKSRSSQQFNLVLPYRYFADEMLGDMIHWNNFNCRTYVLLHENVDVASLNERLTPFVQEKADWGKIGLFLTPFSDLYLYGNYENGKQVGGRIAYVRLFSIIAFFILFIACINFMNLSTAKATRKLKDMGVRKTIGADRQTLIGQYLGESVFMALLALVIALLLTQALLPQFNLLSGKKLALQFDLTTIGILLGITLLTGLLAGSYPALYLSKFEPIKVLKGTFKGAVSELWIRRGLVVFQFTLSILLIVAVLVVYQQIAFIQHKNLGYAKEQLINFPIEGNAQQQHDFFINEMKNIAGVENVSCSQNGLVDDGSFTVGVHWEGKDPESVVRFGVLNTYYDFIETVGIPIKAGRSFSNDYGAEKNNLIINEEAVKAMGLTEPIGKTITFWGEKATIVGVVKDFHFQSLHQAIIPLIFRLNTDFLMHFFVRLEAGKERATLVQLQDFYKTHNPGYTFDYAFLDTKFAVQYEAEQRVATLSKYFAGLAIIISCLGLFGLVTFSAQRRQKEIGIRKVLGASTFSLVRMLSADFTKMVLVAIFIALPLSYFLMSNWLNEFAFRIALQPWFFLVAGLGALAIAWLTVGFQTLKAASVNPTQTLKSE